MTVWELIHKLSSYKSDDEVFIYITDRPIENSRAYNKIEYYKVNDADLFRPSWLVGDRCRLVIKNKEDAQKNTADNGGMSVETGLIYW